MRLRTSLVLGAAGTALWLASVFSAPPVPASAARAVAFVLLAGMAAAFGRATRSARLRSALSAGTVSAFSIVLLANALLSWGPPRLVPEIVPMALTPADRLSNSRIEATDPYVAVLFLGLVFGILLVWTQVALLRRTRVLDQT